jgi:predicted O-methyltransferase YrrM
VELITQFNNGLCLITPLMHADVISCRPNGFFYPAVAKRMERDRESIGNCMKKIEMYCNHENLKQIAARSSLPNEPYWDNGWIPTGDAKALYGMVAAFKPSRIIEIGSGHSTMFMRRAINDFGLESKITSVDPHPRAAIDEICDSIIRKNLNEVDLSLFESLKPDDILFLDGSHLTFNGTDTVRFFLEILPIVSPGVLMHLHDICLPREYIKIFDNRGYSEQYMLATTLMFSDNLEILLPVYCLSALDLFPEGVSFWFQKRLV